MLRYPSVAARARTGRTNACQITRTTPSLYSCGGRIEGLFTVAIFHLFNLNLYRTRSDAESEAGSSAERSKSLERTADGRLAMVIHEKNERELQRNMSSKVLECFVHQCSILTQERSTIQKV